MQITCSCRKIKIRSNIRRYNVLERQVFLRQYCVLMVSLMFDKIKCKMSIEAAQGNCQVLELILDTEDSVSVLPETVYFAPHFTKKIISIFLHQYNLSTSYNSFTFVLSSLLTYTSPQEQSRSIKISSTTFTFS